MKKLDKKIAMINGFVQKNLFITIAVLAAVLVVALIVLSQSSGPTQPAAPAQESVQPVDHERVTDQSPLEVTGQFPSNFPFEENVEILRSFSNIPANTTDLQLGVEYISNRDFSEIVSTFSTYIEQEGFILENEVEESGFHYFYASRDGNGLMITAKTRPDERVGIYVEYLIRR